MVDKIKLVPVTGANNIVNINDNFTKIEKIINDKMLSRKVSTDEVNQVQTDLDMNNNRIYNLPAPRSPTEPLTAGFIGDLTETVEQGQANITASNALVAAATAANQEARDILEDTHIKLDDALVAITDQKNQAISQINTTSSVALADINAKQADVTAKHSDVTTKANTVATQAGQVQVNATDAAASASTASAAANTATTQSGVASGAATAATSASAQAIQANIAAQDAATSAAADAVVASDAADRAEAAANGMDTSWAIDRANHTGVQAINTITGLQTALDSKAGTAVANSFGPTQAFSNGFTSPIMNASVNDVLTVNGNLEIGPTTASGSAYIDLHSDGNSATDYNARIIRNPGTNGQMGITNTGTGGLRVDAGGGEVSLLGLSIKANNVLNAAAGISVTGGANVSSGGLAVGAKSSFYEMAHFTFTAPATANSTITVAHGLNWTKILRVTVHVYMTAAPQIIEAECTLGPDGAPRNNSYWVGYSVNNTTVVVATGPNSGYALGKSGRIVIEYLL